MIRSLGVCREGCLSRFLSCGVVWASSSDIPVFHGVPRTRPDALLSVVPASVAKIPDRRISSPEICRADALVSRFAMFTLKSLSLSAARQSQWRSDLKSSDAIVFESGRSAASSLLGDMCRRVTLPGIATTLEAMRPRRFCQEF